MAVTRSEPAASARVPSPATVGSCSFPEVRKSLFFRQMNMVLRRAVKYFAFFELLSLLLLYANTTNYRTCTDEPRFNPSEMEELERLTETLGKFSGPTQEKLNIIQRCGSLFMTILLTGYWSALTLKILISMNLMWTTAEGEDPIKAMGSCRIWIVAHFIWLVMLGVILFSVDPEGIWVWKEFFPAHAFGPQIVVAFMITG